MEFFPGAFEREWERRRATLLHEMQLGQVDRKDWDEPRRGGAARLSEEGLGGFGRARRRHGGGSSARWSRDGAGAGRSMRTRFSALARGSQPAVVKLASYGGGARAAAMMSYTSRGGDLAVENERGERVLGRDALSEQRAEWEHLFDNRASSRDLGVFLVSVDAASLLNDVDQDEQLREILRSGFGDRRFVYAARERSGRELNVSGVVVLRDGAGERLTGDRKAAEIVQQRFCGSEVGREVEARFRFHGHGNGVEWGTARVRELVGAADGEVRDDTDKLVGDAMQAGDLVQKEWRKALHSRKGRDVMHLIVSARAGTNATAFERAVREFLGEQFSGHRYVFAVHDPALDPKEMAEGGKRPHIHAHAIVTMRSETQDRIVTSPQLFREWRSLMAEKAREQGIDMELTDRREFASAPAYSRNQVRPVSYRDRTEHEGTSAAARARYQAKRSNEMRLAASDRSKHYAATAAQIWTDVANEEPGTPEGKFAMLQKARLEDVAEINQTDLVLEGSKQETVKNAANMIEVSQITNGEDGQMREMTRTEFEAYEKRVEAVLSSVEQTLDAAERNEFDEVAATAREVVDIRREYLAFTEQQSDLAREDSQRGGRDDQRDDTNAQWDAAVARYGRAAVETANEVLIEVEHYREGLSRIEAGELPRTHGASYQNGLAREVQRAAEMAVDGDNQYVREVAKSDQELQRAIELIELAQGQARRNAEREQRGADQASGGIDAKGPGGVPSGIVEREQTRETDRENQSLPDQNVHGVDRENSPASGQESSRDRDRRPDDASRSPTEVARADPPQQHVPRLRQLELEIEERHDRDRDDRER
jgi:hypothetical protein